MWDIMMAKRDFLDQWIPVVAMLLADLALAIVNVLYKKALNDGMSSLLLNFYRQCISAIFLAPIAYVWERRSWENLTVGTVCGLFFSALLGATLCQYFFLSGLGYTSATYTCAFINVVPVVTFILALSLQQEKLNLKSRSGRAKLLGTLVCVGGVLVLILYQGMPVVNAIKSAAAKPQNAKNGAKNWVIGSIFLFVASLMWASWFVIQAQIGKYYAFPYSSTTILSFFATIQSAILCLTVDRNLSSWLPKGSTQITTVLYAGIMGSGICYVALTWCVKKRGAVFTSAFGPFIQVFVAFFDVFLLHEQINLGRQGIAALFLAPIAYLWERKSWENLTVGLVCGLFVSGLLGASLTGFFILTGIAYTSATYYCAFTNAVPVLTFILAISFRKEKLNLKYKSGRAKLLGTIVCLGGVLVLVLYRGRPVINAAKTVTLQKEKHDAHNQAIGSMFLFAGTFTWSSWYIVQSQIGKYYPFQYTSTTMMCFFGAIQSAILCVTTDRNMSSWVPKGILQIITVIYIGLVGTAIRYVALSWCVKKRGPVFTSAFGPNVQVLVAILEVSFLHQQINIGSIVGSLVVIVGMFMLLWGKSKDVNLQRSVEADGRKDNGDGNITLPVSKPAIVSSTNTT